MTQARPACEKPRSRWMEGSATLTIVMSTTIRRKPVQRTISESQRVLFMPLETAPMSRINRFPLPRIPAELKSVLPCGPRGWGDEFPDLTRSNPYGEPEGQPRLRPPPGARAGHDRPPGPTAAAGPQAGVRSRSLFFFKQKTAYEIHS